MFLDFGDANIYSPNRDETEFKIKAGSPHKDYVLQQFTGLLDKNGKEIYEGDIVEYKKRWSSTVVFEDGMFRHKDNGDKISWGALILIHRECEIIGNIYESPELLSTNKDEK